MERAYILLRLIFLVLKNGDKKAYLLRAFLSQLFKIWKGVVLRLQHQLTDACNGQYSITDLSGSKTLSKVVMIVVLTQAGWD